MSIVLDADNDKAVATISSDLSLADDYYWTVGFWFKWDGNAAHGRVIEVACARDGGAIGYYQVRLEANGSGVFYLYSPPGGTFGPSSQALTAGQWNYMALRFAANDKCYLSLKRPGDANVADIISADGGYRASLQRVIFGTDQYPSYNTNRGKYAYARLWTGGTGDNANGMLSTAELDTEAASATRVKSAAGTNEAWTLTTAVTATTNTPTYDFAGTGTAFDTGDNPTFGASGVTKMASYYQMLRSA